MKILESAFKAWEAAADLRQRRERYKRYTYGDQWCDLVPYVNGTVAREEKVLIETGNKPLSNNVIRQLVKTVVGRFRSMAAENGFYKTDPLADIAARNALDEIDSRLMEEFLISGCAIQRIVDERRWNGTGVWIDNVDPRRFFVNVFTDPRGWDINLIGMLHDMSFPEIVNRFAAGSPEKIAAFRRIYNAVDNGIAFPASEFTGKSTDVSDFFTAASDGVCRVIEVWTFDARKREEAAELDFVWHCRYFAPDGTVLAEFDSPYPHRAHPFIVKFYPLTDGEVHSFVEDIIDQQRVINRIVVMLDKILRVSAKGVLLYPMTQMVDGFEWGDICDTWARCDGVIPVKGDEGPLPQQVVTNTANTGAYQLLDLQLRLLSEISGVGDALLGRGSTAKGAEMFENQVRNATIALADIFETFISFTKLRNEKAIALKTA